MCVVAIVVVHPLPAYRGRMSNQVVFCIVLFCAFFSCSCTNYFLVVILVVFVCSCKHLFSLLFSVFTMRRCNCDLIKKIDN